MTFVPGMPKHPDSGRKKGVPNKSTLEMRERCEALIGGMSIPEWMMTKAIEAANQGDLPTAGNISGKAASFVYPSLKAIELQGDIQSAVTLEVIVEKSD